MRLNKQWGEKEMVSLWELASTDRWQLSNRAKSCEDEGYHLPTIKFSVSHSLSHTLSLSNRVQKITVCKLRMFHPSVPHYWNNSYLSTVSFSKALTLSVFSSVLTINTLGTTTKMNTHSSQSAYCNYTILPNTFINILWLPLPHTYSITWGLSKPLPPLLKLELSKWKIPIIQ